MRKALFSIVVVVMLLAITAGTAHPVQAVSGHAQPGAPLCYHIVRPGETLFCIARGYGVDPWAIARANGIVQPNWLFPGQGLSIPPAYAFLPPGPTCARQCGGPVIVPPPPCVATHIVQPGENLFRISMMYNVNMWKIAQANGMYDWNYIRAYYPLCIPPGP